MNQELGGAPRSPFALLQHLPGVYCILNILDNKCYIWSSVDIKVRCKKHFGRLNSRTHDNIHLQRTFNKNGPNCLVPVVIEICGQEELTSREQYYIDKYRTCTNGYNILPTAGSWLGYKHTLESIQKMKEYKTGRPSLMRGKRFSSEARENMRLGAIGRKSSPLSEETKNKLRKKKRSPEQRERYRVAALNRSEDHNKKISEALKRRFLRHKMSQEET